MPGALLTTVKLGWKDERKQLYNIGLREGNTQSSFILLYHIFVDF